MTAHYHLTRHIEASRALAKLARKPDHIAAGLSISVSMGRDGVPVQFTLSAGTEEALAALCSAHDETLALSAAMARAELRDTEKALQAFAEYQGSRDNGKA